MTTKRESFAAFWRIQRQVARVIREANKMTTDTARFDWLENEGEEFRWEVSPDGVWQFSRERNGISGAGVTLREAIDAAMQAAQEAL